MNRPPSSVEPFDSDLEAMEAELAWFEARAKRIITERQLSQSDQPEAPWERGERPTPEALRRRLRVLTDEERALRRHADARAALSTTALERLCATYGLGAPERAVLILAAAPAFSKRLGEVLGALEDGRFGGCGCLTVEILFNFLELSIAERVRARAWFGRGSPLLQNDLVVLSLRDRYAEPEQLLDATLSLTSRTFHFLVGDAVSEDDLLDFSSLEEPRATLGQVVLDAGMKERLLSVVEHHERFLERRADWGVDDVIRYGRGIVMLFHGPPGTGKTMTAHAIADHLGKRILNVDIPTFLDSREHDRFLPALFREARLRDAVLFFDECEALFASRSQGNLLMNVLLTEIERFEGTAILATNEPRALDSALERRLLLRLPFQSPDREERAEIWRRLLPPRAPLSDDVDLTALATRFDLVGGYIKNAVLMAVARISHAGRDVITQADLVAAAESQQIRLSDEDGEPLRIPAARLTDIVLAPSLRLSVGELIDAARDRQRVLSRWGIGAHLSYGKGTVALLHGPPGTGKTLCAEVVAGELGRPLLPCALPSVLSRYVGGTEQNLERLFERATRRGAVLFLDEADSLLHDRAGLRDAHDHRLVNLLLTLIERHEGVVLMATNLRERLDPALLRRVGWMLSFQKPDARQRALIWRSLLPSSAPGASTVDTERLALTYELTGAQIRDVVFRSAFRAARRDMPLCTRDVEQVLVEQTGEPPRVLGWAAEA